MKSHLLLDTLRDPSRALAFSTAEWETWLAFGRRTRLTAHFANVMETHGLIHHIPARVWNHLEAGRIFADYRNRLIRWEMNRIEWVTRHTDIEIILLKGGAYLLLDLPHAKGRLPADLDLLVTRGQLDTMEEILREGGWKTTKLDDYDQRYYREWMHEIPPLRHPERRIEVDVHHALLPLTARLHADPERLWSMSKAVGNSRFKVLAPEDMTLHAVVHLFYDSDFDHRLRDLVDIDALIRHYSAQDAGFTERVREHAEVLGLQRPWEYALHFCHSMLGTPTFPLRSLQAKGSTVALTMMEYLVPRVLLPDSVGRPSRINALARWLLYVRSHYLRMPLRLLIPHLLRKALKKNSVI